MMITTNNNREIWIAMIVLFALGLIWNTYYAKCLNDSYVELLEEKNLESELKIDLAKSQRDSARIERMLLSFRLNELDSKVKLQEDILMTIENEHNIKINHLNNLQDEKSYINSNIDDDVISYLSSYRYREYKK